MKRKNPKLFIITINIKEASWDYKIDQRIRVAVISNNFNNALERFTNEKNGSEFPNYSVVSIEEVNDDAKGFFTNMLS
jgi:hypothetical protein